MIPPDPIPPKGFPPQSYSLAFDHVALVGLVAFMLVLVIIVVVYRLF